MDNGEIVASIQKPSSLDLRHSNNVMLDKNVVIPSRNELCTNNNSNIGTISSSSTRITSEISSDAGMMNSDRGSNEEVCEASALLESTETSSNDNTTSVSGHDPPCAMYGQMIANEDETWELLSDAASWESSFPVDILRYEQETSARSEPSDSLPPNWKQISDPSGNYYWNSETGATQKEHPVSGETLGDAINHTSENAANPEPEVDSEVEISASNATPKSSHRWSGNSTNGHLYLVRSLGWLPIEHENLKPDVSSAAVNSCIRLLSNNRSQIMDGVGVWGEGKDLMLLLNHDHLKVVDPLENTVLQSQLIKHIRVWGVGRDSAHDFAYVVRDPTTRVYKCHVFRSDAPAKAIAKQLHTICSQIVKQKRQTNNESHQSSTELNANNTDEIPAPSAEPTQTFLSKYIGEMKVSKLTGIEVLKQAMGELTSGTDRIEKEVKVYVSPSALIVTGTGGESLVNCRMRCLSFMGVGDDVQLFGFFSVLAGEATCHVLRCEPNAAKLALAVQEACMLRYQKAIDSKQPVKSQAESSRNKSLKTKVLKIFSGWRHGRS